MKQAIQEYAEALQDHTIKCRNLMTATKEKLASHYRLMRAKDNLRAEERDLLEDIDLLQP